MTWTGVERQTTAATQLEHQSVLDQLRLKPWRGSWSAQNECCFPSRLNFLTFNWLPESIETIEAKTQPYIIIYSRNVSSKKKIKSCNDPGHSAGGTFQRFHYSHSDPFLNWDIWISWHKPRISKSNLHLSLRIWRMMQHLYSSTGEQDFSSPVSQIILRLLLFSDFSVSFSKYLTHGVLRNPIIIPVSKLII